MKEPYLFLKYIFFLHPIDLNDEDSDGLTGFTWACAKGHEKIVEIMIQNSVKLNIDLNVQTKCYRFSPFHLACNNGHTNVVKTIISNLEFLENTSKFDKGSRGLFGKLSKKKSRQKLNIELNSRSLMHSTAFHLSCMNGHSKIVEMLIQKSDELNIDLNAVDYTRSEGRTAFQWVCAVGNSEIVKILMENSIEFSIHLNAKDKVGYTAFHNACEHGQLQVAEMLMKKSKGKDIFQFKISPLEGNQINVR